MSTCGSSTKWGSNKHVVVWDSDSTSIGYRLDRSCKRPCSGQAFPSYESMINNRAVNRASR